MKKQKEESNKIEINEESYKELEKELKNRTEVLRKEVAEKVAEARTLGDLSENHPYAVAMGMRDTNEDRIVELEYMLRNAVVLKGNSNNKFVVIGKKVQIKNLSTSKTREVTLVGSENAHVANPKEGEISIGSPIGKALYKSKIGDTISVQTPSGKVEFSIVKFV